MYSRKALGLGWDTVKDIIKARLEKDYLLLMRRDNVDAHRLPLLQVALKHNEPLNIG